MKLRYLKQYIAACFVVVMIVISGCTATSGKYVKMVSDDHVKQAFERFEVDSNYTYYYTGRSSYPRAFVGISKNFTMDSKFWTPINLTSEHLQNWIWGHANRVPGNLQRYGSNIIGPNGEHVGIWYSLEDWQQWARIVLTKENTVKIGVPINTSSNRPFGISARF